MNKPLNQNLMLEALKLATFFSETLAPDYAESGDEHTAKDLSRAAVLMRRLCIELAKSQDSAAIAQIAMEEVSIEISRLNRSFGETVFNPAATQALRSQIRA